MGIAIKVGKQVTSLNQSQKYLASYAPSCIGYTIVTQSQLQMYVQINHSLAHLQDLILTLAVINIPIQYYIASYIIQNTQEPK